jgi:chaperonin GroES
LKNGWEICSHPLYPRLSAPITGVEVSDGARSPAQEFKMKFKPLNDRILIKRLDSDTKTAGGIIIPENAKEKPVEGQVVAVGAGKVLDNGNVLPLEVKTGDVVFFKKYAGTEITVEGAEHLIMREGDVLAVVEK